jgi:hypothetical protein
MANDIEKIKTKIKKLLSLSGSDNVNEAASALEMAQELMRRYGLEHDDINIFEIIEKEIRGNSGRKPPIYESDLICAISDAFGCRSAYGCIASDRKQPQYGHTFVGIEYRAQIASFIAEVLLRKLRKARSRHYKTLCRVRTRHKKICRADEYCVGWVDEVCEKLTRFTNSPEEESAIAAYEKRLGWGNELKKIDRKDKHKWNWKDYAKGRKDGDDVVIQHGVSAMEKRENLLPATQAHGGTAC